MRNDRVFVAVLVGALALVFVLLVTIVVKVHRLEARFIVQGKQLRALGEATDRLSAAGPRRESGPAAPDGPPPGVKFLHPELENFFKPADTRWPAPGAETDGVLTRGWWSGDPKGFNPVLENASVTWEFVWTYAQYLLGERNGWTDPSVWHAEAAYRLEIGDDYKEYTFYLRPGMTWHEPCGVDLDDPKYAWLRGSHPYTAEDFAFTLDMIMNPAVNSGPLRNYFAELESWRAPDPHTLILRWKKRQFTNLSFSIAGIVPVPKFLYAFDQNGKPLPEESLGQAFNQHWYNNKCFLGAGPYRMTSYVPGSKIVMERNESFVGPKPAVKTLVYPIYTDTNQTLLRLKAHELTFGELQPGQYREEVLQYANVAPQPKSLFLDGSIECRPVPEISYRYVGWNQQRPFFRDKRVRRAMTYAFDRQRIIDKVYNGLGTPTTAPYPLEATQYLDPAVKPIPFDVGQSRKLLAEAGWTDTDGDGLVDNVVDAAANRRVPFEFTLLVSAARRESRTAADIFREDLLKAGVKMNIETVEWSLFLKRMDERSVDAFLSAWGMLWEPDLYQIWHSSQADLPRASNRVGFRNKEADAIIEALRESFDPKERTELLRRFHRLLDDEQPFSFLMNPKLVYCFWNDLENVGFSKVFPVANLLPWWVSRKAP